MDVVRTLAIFGTIAVVNPLATRRFPIFTSSIWLPIRMRRPHRVVLRLLWVLALASPTNALFDFLDGFSNTFLTALDWGGGVARNFFIHGFYGIFDGGPIEMITKRKLNCMIQTFLTPLDPPNFRADSVTILPQAGVYIGQESILEYVSFATSGSPYVIGSDPLVQPMVPYIYGVENGLCESAQALTIAYDNNPETTTTGQPLTLTMLFKMSIDVNEGYIKKLYVYYNDAFLNFYFNNELNGPNTINFICNVLNNQCADYVPEPARADCNERLAALPKLTQPNARFDGNTLGCRALHATFAATNTKHCGHIAIDPTADPDGEVKCQNSAFIPIDSLFTEFDFSWFRRFQEKSGFDPNQGFKLGI